MHDTRVESTIIGQGGPRSMTPTDLIALVVGCAVAFRLPWIHGTPSTIIYHMVNMPPWIEVAFLFGEVARKAGLAIIPVILVRRMRHGGLPRPAEWLAIFAGASLVPELIQGDDRILRFGRWCFVDLRTHLGLQVPMPTRKNGWIDYGNVLYSGYEGFPTDYTPNDQYRIWQGLMLAILAGSLSLLGLLCTKLPHGVKVGLLIIAAFASVGGIGPWMIYPRSIDYLDGPAWALPWLPRSSLVLRLLCSFPVEVLLGIPALLTLIALRRRETRNWAWTDWVGVVVAIVCFIQYELPEAYVSVFGYSMEFSRGFLPANSGPVVQVGHLTAAGLIAWLIIKRFSPAWNRWTNTNTEMSPKPS